jgi:hypothetical protein
MELAQGNVKEWMAVAVNTERGVPGIVSEKRARRELLSAWE